MLLDNKIAFLAVVAVLSAVPPASAQEPRGAHGSLLRLPKGFVSPAHHHTGDYYGVIVEGAVTNAEAGQQEVVLGPGSYYVQKGKADHVTKCVGDTDCLVYISQSRAFDFIPSGK